MADCEFGRSGNRFNLYSTCKCSYPLQIVDQYGFPTTGILFRKHYVLCMHDPLISHARRGAMNERFSWHCCPNALTALEWLEWLLLTTIPSSTPKDEGPKSISALELIWFHVLGPLASGEFSCVVNWLPSTWENTFYIVVTDWFFPLGKILLR